MIESAFSLPKAYTRGCICQRYRSTRFGKKIDDRPLRKVVDMFRYHDLASVPDGVHPSYLKFEDSEVVESVHDYMVVKTKEEANASTRS